MRYSTLLLASSIGLRGSDIHVADATAASVIPDNDPNDVHKFLEPKNVTRPQSLRKSNEEDERMLPIPAQEISELVAGKSQKIMGTEKKLPQAPQKSLEVIFEEIRERALGPSAIDQVESIFATMKTKDLKKAVKVFKKQKKFLADEFIAGWEIKPVATALVKAKHSDNKRIKANGKILLDDLVSSLDTYTHSDNPDVFGRVKLDANDVELAGFTDARVELLFDLIKFKLDRKQETIATLSKGFRTYGNMAHIIGLAKAAADKSAADKKSAETVEKMFVKYFVLDPRFDLNKFYNVLAVPVKKDDSMLKRHQFEMMETFLALKGVPEEEIPKKVLRMLIDWFGDDVAYSQLAIELTKAVKNPQVTTVATQYQELLFQRVGKLYPFENAPDKIGLYYDLSIPELETFVQSYQQWRAKEKTPINPEGDFSSV